MRRWAAVAVVVVTLLLGACSTAAPAPPGRPPAAPLPEVPLGPLTLTGDPRAANPCDLLDPRSFGASWYPVALSGDSVGSCRIQGRAADDRLQALEAVYDSEAATTYTSGEPVRQLGAASVLSPTPSDDVCRRVVRLVDGTLVVFSGRGQAGSRWVADCEGAERAMRAGVATLAARGITYTPGWFADRSLVAADACAALGDPAPLLGVVDPPRYPGFGGWRCLVGEPLPGRAVAWTDFVVIDDYAPIPAGRSTTVGTTPAVVTSYPGQFSPGCQLYLDRGPVGPPEYRQRQMVRVTVERPAPAEVSCAQVVTVAEGVVARLPA
ncbi:hypothetical protein WCD74_06445 [Actinomycetospora sp. OC33-EN08]|uniref:DUF3558 domain-containing protein n=1 Tax=Actinomycetospora aurantiaca TaxID=3129233 RepID=A0ABU8MJ99_9PSEU